MGIQVCVYVYVYTGVCISVWRGLTRTLVVHCSYHKFRPFLQTVQKVVNEAGYFLCVIRSEGVFMPLDRYHGEALTISSPMKID